MRAFQVTEYGRPPEWQERPEPAPGPGEVLVRVRAVGLNFADLLQMQGKYQERPPLPVTLGMEFAGEVAALGAGVTSLAVGRRIVAFAGHGGLADLAVVPVDRCAPIPDGVEDVVAGGVPIAYGTSHLALAHRAALQPGERLVVTGAAGGVGLTAVEIGAAMGAEVIAVARGAEKLAVAEAAGARHLIDADVPDLRERLKALGGIAVAYETVGGALWEACFRAARPEARLLAIGFAGGDVPQIKANHLLVKNLTVMGLYWGGYFAFAPEIATRSLAQIFDWIAAGRLAPHVSHVLPAEKAAEGLELIRSRQAVGKVVVRLAE